MIPSRSSRWKKRRNGFGFSDHRLNSIRLDEIGAPDRASIEPVIDTIAQIVRKIRTLVLGKKNPPER